ncbi:MAG: CAP domain-containing protein [Patescibacteria group bacterium]
MRLLRMLHHWLVPHEGNNHRAKALHTEALFAYVLLLAVFNLGIKFFHTKAPDVLGYATDIRVEQLLASTNAKRAEAGLDALTLNGTLSQAAAAKAADMLANNYWAHNSPLGKTPWDFIISAGYRYTLAGENLAKNFQTSSGVVDAWMNSPTHKANIFKAGYREVGFAVVNGVLAGEETTLVVQMFGATNAAPIAQIPKAQAAGPAPAVAKPVQQVATVVPTEPAVQVQSPVKQSEIVLLPSFTPNTSFEQVITTPRINITSLTSNVTFVVVGLLIGLLAVDAFVVKRKHVVRLVGHNLAHILFLATIIISGLSMARGSLI